MLTRLRKKVTVFFNYQKEKLEKTKQIRQEDQKSEKRDKLKILTKNHLATFYPGPEISLSSWFKTLT